jgi:predicted Fe-Mo cluster-binding NifX family protein
MKVCVPSLDDGGLDDQMSSHFGRAPNYTLYDTTDGTVEVIANDGQHHGGRRAPPQIIAETGADALVCGNLGQKAVQRFDAMDVDVYCGADGTVEDAIEQLEADELEAALPGGDHCSGHDHGDGHGHGHDHEHSHSH